MKARLARLLLHWACRLDPGVTNPVTAPLRACIFDLQADLRKYQAAHDRVTNELAHYIATAYSR